MATIGELTRQYSRFPRGRAVTLVGVSAETRRTIYSGLPIEPSEQWLKKRGIPQSAVRLDATIGEVLYTAPNRFGFDATNLRVLASTKTHRKAGEIIEVDAHFRNYIGGKDDRVAQELAKAHIYIDPVMDHDGQIVGVDVKKGWVFKSHGVNIAVQPAGPYIARYYLMLPNVLAGEVDFLPKGRSEFAYETISENVLASLVGLQKFFEMVDSGKPEPEFLYGKTNKRMAEFAARFGFTHKHDGRNAPPGHASYHVFGNTQVVRESLDLLVARRDRQGRTILEKLEQRV